MNCTELDHEQWSYSIAMYLYGSAIMQNYTNGSTVWVQRTSGFLEATSTFFTPFENASNIMFEAECELTDTCDVDQLSFKAYLSRWLAGTSLVAPFTASRVGTLLRASAIGASYACTGPPYGNFISVYSQTFANRRSQAIHVARNGTSTKLMEVVALVSSSAPWRLCMHCW